MDLGEEKQVKNGLLASSLNSDWSCYAIGGS